MDRLIKQSLLWMMVALWLTTVTAEIDQQETTSAPPSIGGGGGGLNLTTAPNDSGRMNVALVTTKPGGGQLICLDECRCSFFGQDVKIRCDSEDTMTSFPVLAKEHNMSRIREIVISYQPRLTQINSSSLVHYTSLEKLTIENSGLEDIRPDTFRSNEKLKTIILRGNRLTVVPWTIIDGLRVTDMNIEDNPIACGCDAKWLINPREVFPNKLVRRSEACLSGKDKRTLKEMALNDCALPMVEVLEESIRVNVSDRVEVVCRGRGSPGPRVNWIPLTWWKEGDYEVTLSNDGQTATLTIANATPEHSGEITCLVDNAVGRVQAFTELYVLSAPKILSLKVQEAFHWYIRYEVSGLPVPNVTWYRDSLPILMNDNVYDKSSVEDSYVSRKGCLTFTIANHLNNGNYTLVVDNEYGKDARTISAVFLNSPDSVFHQLPVVSDRTVDDVEEEDDRTSERPDGLDQHGLGPHGNGSQATEDSVRIIIIIAVVAFTSAVILIGSICCVVVLHRKRRAAASQKNRCFRSICPERNRNSVYCDTIAREMIPLNSARIVDNPNYFKQDPTIPQVKIVIPRIPPQHIQVLRDLGEGAFGRVVLGTCRLTEPEGDHRLTLVAIKTLKESHAEDAKRDFDREAELLTSLQHDNIIRLYGISEDGDTRMIIFEYMENGDLNNFLRSHGPDARFLGKGMQATKPSLRMRDLLHISNQISAGAEYLSRKHFVHRDLATRNCLVGEKLIVKIGDFGMSRDVYSADYYKVGGQTMLPIRWMPYESIIYRTFTMESDVWSFGVVLWEIFSFGKQPWYELTNHEVIQHLEMGKVLDCPVGGHCPDEIYRLMLGCWRKHPEDRLSMSQLHVHLTRLLQYFSNDPAASSTHDYLSKHVSYLEILSDDTA